jgi:hypothetical protein
MMEQDGSQQPTLSTSSPSHEFGGLVPTARRSTSEHIGPAGAPGVAVRADHDGAA